MSRKIKIAVETQKSEYREIPDPSDLKFTPMVAGSSYQNRLSKLKDLLLKPFLNKIKSYVWDDIHFLNSIPQKNCPRHTWRHKPVQ